MSYSKLKQNKEIKDQFEICLSSQFDSKISIQMIKTLKRDNTRAIALILIYDNRMLLIFKVLGVIVY